VGAPSITWCMMRGMDSGQWPVEANAVDGPGSRDNVSRVIAYSYSIPRR
jgi:hypothetical protein